MTPGSSSSTATTSSDRCSTRSRGPPIRRSWSTGRRSRARTCRACWTAAKSPSSTIPTCRPKSWRAAKSCGTSCSSAPVRRATWMSRRCAAGVTVHAIKGYGDTAVAEHAIALMFACARDIARMDREIRAGIGARARACSSRANVSGSSAWAGSAPEVGANRARHRHGGSRLEPDAAAGWPRRWDRGVLREADVVSLHLALTDETRGFLDAGRLALLKRGAILVNTARGALIDEAALVGSSGSGPYRARRPGRVRSRAACGRPSARSARSVTLSAHSGFRTHEASVTLLGRALDIVRRLAVRHDGIELKHRRGVHDW